MTTDNTKLEQIAKQVSLLNRLIELLMAHENQFEVTKYSGYFVEYTEAEYNLLNLEDKFHYVDGKRERSKKYVSRPPEYLGWEIQDTDGKSLTQKAWGDELVKVARELNDPDPRIEMTLFPILEALEIRGIQPANLLEAILNKYYRSLSE
jgi:hypothetical protein